MEICMSIASLVSWLIIFVMLGSIALWVGRAVYNYARVQALHSDALAWITDHQRRLTGNNRYPVGENYFSQHFFEYPPHITRRVWIRLLKDGSIHRSTIDGEWIVGGAG